MFRRLMRGVKWLRAIYRRNHPLNKEIIPGSTIFVDGEKSDPWQKTSAFESQPNTQSDEQGTGHALKKVRGAVAVTKPARERRGEQHQHQAIQRAIENEHRSEE